MLGELAIKVSMGALSDTKPRESKEPSLQEEHCTKWGFSFAVQLSEFRAS